MLSAYTMSAIFRSGDLQFRPRSVAQRFVVMTCKDDPVRCMEVMAALNEHGGGDRSSGMNHAARLFLDLVREARVRPFSFDLMLTHRRAAFRAPLPGTPAWGAREAGR